MADKLKIISLGGINEIGKNLTVYEYGNDIIIVDCGLGFPDPGKLGVDIVIPDMSYLVQNKKKLRGIFITHGHEDHIGALPYLLHQVQVPIYATNMSLGLIELKLKEHALASCVKLIPCSAGDKVTAGSFQVEFIHVNHSIPDAVAFGITCPIGTCIHTGDFKIDPTPVKGTMIDLARLGTLGGNGVLALLADSTNVERSGYTRSESSVGASLEPFFCGCRERIIITTFSSNVDRIQQILNLAQKYGRKVAVTGRSMESILQVASESDYITVPDGVLRELNHVLTLPKEEICIITTGSQGEPMSALTRIALGTHKQIALIPHDRIIFSSSSIPGNEPAICRVVDALYQKGAEVIDAPGLGLHASGHACQEELKIIHALVRPKFFIPIHGEHRMLQLHARLAQQVGQSQDHILISEIGHIIELTKESIRDAGTVPSGEILVDNYGQNGISGNTLKERQRLAEDGVILAVLPISNSKCSLKKAPSIIARGFSYNKESDHLLRDLRGIASDVCSVALENGHSDWATIKVDVRKALGDYLYHKTRKSPVILPIIVDV